MKVTKVFKVIITSLLIIAFTVSVMSCKKATIADINGLIQKLKVEDSDVLFRATKALVAIGEPAVEPLIKALEGGYGDVEISAKNVLVEIGEPAVEPLIKALKDKDSGVRMWTTDALGEIGGARAVEALIVALKHEDSKVRYSAAYALEQITWQPKDNAEKAYYLIAKEEWSELVKLDEPAVEPLIKALKDKDSGVRISAADALGEIGDARAVEALIVALKDENLEVIASAYEFFLKRGEPGTESILIKALNNYGTKSMAVDFLNCGNSQLDKAATGWAHSHGYYIVSSGSGGGGPIWGSGQ